MLCFSLVSFLSNSFHLYCCYSTQWSECFVFFQWVIPEMVGQCLSTMLMLVSMHWFIFLLNLPVAVWNIYRYRQTAVSLLRMRIWLHLCWIIKHFETKTKKKQHWNVLFLFSMLLTYVSYDVLWCISPFCIMYSQSQSRSVIIHLFLIV